MFERKALLNKLIALNSELEPTMRALRTFGWDSEDYIAELLRSDIISVLERYYNNQLTALEVEDWANAIEGRDDIGFESGHEVVILSVIHELANPLLTQALSKMVARDLITQLNVSS